MNDINLFKSKNSIFLKTISSKSDLVKEEKVDGYLIKSSESEARRIIQSLKGQNKIIVFSGGNNALNRRAIETLKINYLVSAEKNSREDSLKQRDSGLNHVLAKQAKKKKISILINLFEIKKLKGKELSIILSKLIQNVSICRKASCPIKIANLSSKKTALIGETGRKSFGTSIGMSSKQSKNSIIF